MARHRRKARAGDRDPRIGGKLDAPGRAGTESTFPAECRRKNIYATKNLARDAASRATKGIGEPIEAYKCSAGGVRHFHIGHPPGWKRRQARQERAQATG